DRRDQQGCARRQARSGGDQIQSPDSQRPADYLLAGQHVVEWQAGELAQRSRRFVVEGERDVRLLHEQIIRQHGRVPQVLENRNVNLRIRLQIGVPGKLEVVEKR